MLYQNVPPISLRYWIVISIASVFGANLGDFVSHVLHLGHFRELPFLAGLFALLLLAERRRLISGEACYWLAIVLLRTAATNLADLATHDFRLAYAWVIVGLSAWLVPLSKPRGTAAAGRDAASLPVIDNRYWAAMLTAGILGTAIGDGVSDGLGLGAGLGSTLLVPVLAITLALTRRDGWETPACCWISIVAVRSAGTTVGDLLADRDGAAPSLPLSTACMAALLAGTLLMWQQRHSPALRSR